MARLTYNGVELAYCETLQLSQVPRLDDSNTDYLFTETTIRVRGILTSQLTPASAAIGPNEIDPDADPVAAYPTGYALSLVEEKLRTPRRPLTFITDDVGGVPIVVPGLTPTSTVTDDRNGPFPFGVSVTQLTSTTFQVEFGVVARLFTPCENGKPTYLSNRWTEASSYAPDGICTRRRMGVLQLRTAGAGPDSLRGLITPGVPQGFRREAADYSLTPDGLTVSYTFTDKQMHRPPPQGTEGNEVVKMTGQNGEVTTHVSGAGVRKGHLTIRLDGRKGVDKVKLLAIALRAAYSRIFPTNVFVDPAFGRVIVQGGVTESLDDDRNSVEVSFTWNIATGKARFIPNVAGAIGDGAIPALNADGKDQRGVPGAIAGWIDLPIPGSSDTATVGPTLFGAASLVKLVAAALDDPCGTVTELRAGSGPNFLVGADPSGTPVVTVSLTDRVPNDASALWRDDSSTTGVFERLDVVSHYTHDTGERVYPSTKEGEDGQRIRRHNPVTALRCEWTMSKMGGVPSIPDPTNAPYDWVSTRSTTSPSQLELAADGVSLVFGCSGVYDYQSLKACKVPVVAPLPPFLDKSLTRDKTKLTTSSRDRDIIFPVTDQSTCNIFCCPSTGSTGTAEGTGITGSSLVGNPGNLFPGPGR